MLEGTTRHAIDCHIESIIVATSIISSCIIDILYYRYML
jgi:hypothetical protein